MVGGGGGCGGVGWKIGVNFGIMCRSGVIEGQSAAGTAGFFALLELLQLNCNAPKTRENSSKR